MKRFKWLVPVLLLVVTLWAIPVQASAYVNGFAADGSVEPAVYRSGAYEIANAGQLYWFAQQVNGGRTTINGRLTADIVINEGEIIGSRDYEMTNYRLWTVIGSSSLPYSGVFDGNGRSISGLYYYCEDYTQAQERGGWARCSTARRGRSKT